MIQAVQGAEPTRLHYIHTPFFTREVPKYVIFNCAVSQSMGDHFGTFDWLTSTSDMGKSVIANQSILT